MNVKHEKTVRNNMKTFPLLHFYQGKEKRQKKREKESDPELISNYSAWQNSELTLCAEHD
jgi:hypothetical protein